jgi:hypothetical protein
VSGTVTLNGQAVPAGCGVAFLSPEGFAASGVVEAEGAYELTIIGNNGKRTIDIPTGTYSVSVSEPPQPELSEEDYDAMMENSATAAGPSGAADDVETLPAKYQSMDTSGLSYEVKEGANTIDIVLSQ